MSKRGQSDAQEKRASLLASQPFLRRLIQISCLGLFACLFFHVAWPYATVFSSSVFADKEFLPVELFLSLDPLVGLSTGVCGRRFTVGVVWGLAVLLVSLLVPRGFCGYVCPLGTSIDLFDWLFGRWLKSCRSGGRTRTDRLRFCVLISVIASSACGTLLAGYVAAIPVLTRGALLTLGSPQLGLMKNWGLVRPYSWGACLSLALFAGVFLLTFLGRRSWCRYLCPSGALFSAASLLRLTERRVEDTCSNCGKCVPVCTFDAIRPDYTTRALNCTFCRTCQSVRPADAVRFGWRQPRSGTANAPEVPQRGLAVSRRCFLSSAAGGVVAGLAVGAASGTKPLRPPGSVSEEQFLDLCIRCGECIKVCPGPVLHLAGFEGGIEGLWTPVAVPSWAGCHQDCNFCTQVCPTGAIRPLSVAEKRKARMGLAVVDTRTCLAHAGERECRLCLEECRAAGYDAIRMREIKLEIGYTPDGMFSALELDEMSRIEAPFIDTDACVGCGLCEYRCHSSHVKGERLLNASAITVEPPG